MSKFVPILWFAAFFVIVAAIAGVASLVRQGRPDASPSRRTDRGRVRFWLTHRRWPSRGDVGPGNR